MRPPASTITGKQVNCAQIQHSMCPPADLQFMAMSMPTAMLTSALPDMLVRYGTGSVAILVQGVLCLCLQALLLVLSFLNSLLLRSHTAVHQLICNTTILMSPYLSFSR